MHTHVNFTIASSLDLLLEQITKRERLLLHELGHLVVVPHPHGVEGGDHHLPALPCGLSARKAHP